MGFETAGTAIEFRETETLATIHEHAGKLLTLGNRQSWNLGTKAEILERFAANSVPLLHKTMMLLELKE